MARCEKNLVSNKTLTDLKTKVRNFKDAMPIVVALRNTKLAEDYHWPKIRNIVKDPNFDVNKEDFKLKDLIAMDIVGHLEEI